MLNLKRANGVAEEVVARGGVPHFDMDLPDTEVFVPDAFTHGSLGHYEAQKLGGIGQAHLDEVVKAFYGKVPSLELQHVLTYDFTDRDTLAAICKSAGIMQDAAILSRQWTIRRSSSMFDPPQTINYQESPPVKYPRRYNAHTKPYFSYASNFWLSAITKAEENPKIVHIPLFHVTRESHLSTVREVRSQHLPELPDQR